MQVSDSAESMEPEWGGAAWPDVPVDLEVLASAKGLALPAPATAQSAGVDLRAAVAADDPLTVRPGEVRAVPTGLRIALPHGYEGQVRPRSGLALRYGLTVANAPGTIDADFRGEVTVLLTVLGSDAVTVERGDRIAQLVIGRSWHPRFRLVSQLPDTERGDGGFGSTGVHEGDDSR